MCNSKYSAFPAPSLHGGPELVGEHDAQGEAPELVVQARDEVDVVPDQVVRGAEERVLGNVDVAR